MAVASDGGKALLHALRGIVLHGKDCRKLAVERDVHRLAHLGAAVHMHAHAPHKLQRAQQHHVADDFSADAAAVIEAEAVNHVVTSVVLVQKLVKQGEQRAAGAARCGCGVGNDPVGVAAVYLKAVERQTPLGEQIVVTHQNGVVAAEDLGPVIAAQSGL